jgi:UPF0755 protein
MKHVSVTAALIAAVLFLAAIHFSWLYYRDTGSSDSARVEVKIPSGMTFQQVSDLLVERGILTNPGVFRWAAWLTRREDDIKTGRYLFRYGESVQKILRKLVNGEIEYWRVVIPEGLNLSEIAGVVQRQAEIDSAAFDSLGHDPRFVADLGIPAPTLEGYLFPDTYLFAWPVTPEKAARRMVRRFRDIYALLVAPAADSIGMKLNEIVTLASIVQAEAVFDSEMPRIAAVYQNRLRKGMRLEADPTVAYALGGVRRPLRLRDLKVDSPYNTYRVRGLPPGPVCSPGRAALLAVVAPVQGTGEFYFVADGTGRHLFSRTYEDHLRNKHRIRYGAVPTGLREDVPAGSEASGPPTPETAGTGSPAPPEEETPRPEGPPRD